MSEGQLTSSSLQMIVALRACRKTLALCQGTSSQASGKLDAEGGGAFNPRIKPAEWTWASQSEEKLIRAVGRGFIPGTKTMESAVALATEVCFRGASQEIMPFSASSSAPEGMLAR